MLYAMIIYSEIGISKHKGCSVHSTPVSVVSAAAGCPIVVFVTDA